MEKLETGKVYKNKYTIVKINKDCEATAYLKNKDLDCFTSKIDEAVLFDSIREAESIALRDNEVVAIMSLEIKLATFVPQE